MPSAPNANCSLPPRSSATIRYGASIMITRRVLVRSATYHGITTALRCIAMIFLFHSEVAVPKEAPRSAQATQRSTQTPAIWEMFPCFKAGLGIDASADIYVYYLPFSSSSRSAVSSGTADVMTPFAKEALTSSPLQMSQFLSSIYSDHTHSAA